MTITPRRRLILIVACLLIVITILRETGVVTLNLYRSSMNSNSSTSWNDTSDHIGCPEPNDSTGECIPLSGNQVSQITFAGDRSFRDNTDSCSTLTFYLSSNNSGLFWTPLFKYVNFSATATCGQTLRIRDKDKNYKFCKLHNINGVVTITGSIRVIGFCSYYEVKNMILNSLVQAVHQQGREQLQNL